MADALSYTPFEAEQQVMHPYSVNGLHDEAIAAILSFSPMKCAQGLSEVTYQDGLDMVITMTLLILANSKLLGMI